MWENLAKGKAKLIKEKRWFLSYYLLFFSLFLFLLQPALSQQLTGTFKPYDVPLAYREFKDFLARDQQFYRTLWIPRQNRFTFSSPLHPSIESEPLLTATNAAELKKFLQRQKTQNYFANLSIKYIIVPYDPYGEIFTDDRKYSQKKRNEVEKILDQVTWLKKINKGKLTIYKTSSYKDHIYLVDDNQKINYVRHSSTKYILNLTTKYPTTLIFAENYSPYWKAVVDNQEISSKKTDEQLNCFVIKNPGKHTIRIYYSFEKYYIIGRVISLVTIGFLFFSIVILKKKTYEK